MKDVEVIHLLLDDGWEINRVQSNYCVLTKGNMIQALPFLNREVPADIEKKVLGRGH